MPLTPKHENILTDDARLPNEVVMGYGSPQQVLENAISPRPTFPLPFKKQNTTNYDKNDIKVNSIGLDDEIFEYNIIDK
jgi:hypothetical protein